MRKHVFWIKLALVVLLLAFIWGNSLLPGELSGQESELARRLLEPAVAVLQRALSARGYEYSQSFLVRKAAHFTEYALLGVCMFVLLMKPEGRGRYLSTAWLCLNAAAVDECIQLFSIDRGPSPRDVALDFAGACAGILFAALAAAILRPRGRKKA